MTVRLDLSPSDADWLATLLQELASGRLGQAAESCQQRFPHGFCRCPLHIHAGIDLHSYVDTPQGDRILRQTIQDLQQHQHSIAASTDTTTQEGGGT